MAVNAFALHNAARNADMDSLSKLLLSGADLNARDNLSRTALHLAAWAGHSVREARLLFPRLAAGPPLH